MLAVDPATTTVGQLKARVEEVTGVPAAEQSLFSGSAADVSGGGSAALSNDGATLGSYGMVSGGVASLVLGGAPPSAGVAFGVYVEMPSSLAGLYGDRLRVAMPSSSSTVADVAAKVAAITGLAAADVALSFGSTALTTLSI